jgi:hypothetical protein
LSQALINSATAKSSIRRKVVSFGLTARRSDEAVCIGVPCRWPDEALIPLVFDRSIQTQWLYFIDFPIFSTAGSCVVTTEVITSVIDWLLCWRIRNIWKVRNVWPATAVGTLGKGRSLGGANQEAHYRGDKKPLFKRDIAE